MAAGLVRAPLWPFHYETYIMKNLAFGRREINANDRIPVDKVTTENMTE